MLSWTLGGYWRDEKFRCVETARRTGTRCLNPAVAGTRHCVRHGGRSFTVQVRDVRWELEAAVDEHLRRLGYDVPRDRSRG